MGEMKKLRDNLNDELNELKNEIINKLKLSKEESKELFELSDELTRMIWDERIHGFGMIVFDKDGKAIPIIDGENLRLVE